MKSIDFTGYKVDAPLISNPRTPINTSPCSSTHMPHQHRTHSSSAPHTDITLHTPNVRARTHTHNQQIALQFNDHGSEVPTKKYRKWNLNTKKYVKLNPNTMHYIIRIGKWIDLSFIKVTI